MGGRRVDGRVRLDLARSQAASSCGSATPSTGTIREVLEEKAETFFESGNGRGQLALPAGVERSHLVLGARQLGTPVPPRSAAPAARSMPITSGEGNVTQLLRVDETNRAAVLRRASARRSGRDPYFRHLYRIGMDGRNLQLLTPADADHDVTLSPSGKFFVDIYSKPDVPPVAGAARRRRRAGHGAREGGHLPADGHRLAAADADHGQGSRRRRPISTA